MPRKDERDKPGRRRPRKTRPATLVKDAAGAGEKSLLIDRARQVIQETPEIRSEKIASLQEAIERGAYKIDSRKLANILIAKMLLDE